MKVNIELRHDFWPKSPKCVVTRFSSHPAFYGITHYLVGMFLRKVSRKNKDGSTVNYAQLVHDIRDKHRGHSQARVLYNFGRLENLDVDQLKRLVQSISRFLPPPVQLEAQAPFATVANRCLAPTNKLAITEWGNMMCFSLDLHKSMCSFCIAPWTCC